MFGSFWKIFDATFGQETSSTGCVCSWEWSDLCGT